MKFALSCMDRSRSGPLEPTRFNLLSEDKTLTNSGDRDGVVLPKCARTFSAVVANADALSLVGMQFGDE